MLGVECTAEDQLLEFIARRNYTRHEIEERFVRLPVINAGTGSEETADICFRAVRMPPLEKRIFGSSDITSSTRKFSRLRLISGGKTFTPLDLASFAIVVGP